MGATTTIVILSFVLFASCIIAQDGSASQITPVRLYSDPTVLSITPKLGAITCNADIYVLRNDAQCLTRLQPVRGDEDDDATNDYTSTAMDCPAEFANVIALKCMPTNAYKTPGTAAYCYGLTPNSIVVTDRDLNYLLTYDLSANISAAKVFDVFWYYPGEHEWPDLGFVELIIADNTDLWVLHASYMDAYDESENTVTRIASLTGEVVGLGGFVRWDLVGSVMVAYAGETTLYVHDMFTGELINSFGTFGDIRMMSMDLLENVHVFDATTNSILVVSDSGDLVRSVTLPSGSVPAYMTQSRNKGLVADSAGLLKYEEDMVFTFSTTPNTCATKEGKLEVQVSGGDYPILGVVRPGWKGIDAGHTLVNMAVLYNPGNMTVKISGDYAVAAPEGPYTILDDVQPPLFGFVGTATGKGFVHKSVFPAQSGDYSYGFNISTKFFLNIQGTGARSYAINASLFEYLEFWVNSGEGGQTFTFILQGVGFYIKTFTPADLPPRTWVKHTVHLTAIFPKDFYSTNSTVVEYMQMLFTDATGLPRQNRIYVDNIRLIPYDVTPGQRKLYMFDYCGLKAVSNFSYEYNPMRLQILTKPVSCNANSTTDTELAWNGALIANVTNGFPPYTYNWVWGSVGNTDTAAGFAYMTTHITLFDNALNTSWKDISLTTSYSLTATKYVYTPPYSISFTPKFEGDAIIFIIYPEISTLDFNIVEYWVHGGDEGGQTYQVVMSRTLGSTSTSTGTAIGAFFPNTVIGNLVVTRRWTKVTLTVPVNTAIGQRYNQLAFVNLVSSTYATTPQNFITSQSTFYIDEVRLVGKPALTVTDSTGCKVSSGIATVTTPPALVETIQVSNVKCFNESSGGVGLIMQGGVPPYSYKWSTDETTAEVNGKPESVVHVDVIDSNSCEFKPLQASILQPPPIGVDISITSPTCNGGSGVAFASSYGGAGSYTYSWISQISGGVRTFSSAAPDPIFLDDVIAPFSLNNAQPLCEGAGTHLPTTYPENVYPSHSGYCTLSLFTISSTTASLSGCASCLTPIRYNKVLFWAYSDNATALQLTSVALSNASFAISTSVSFGEVASVVSGNWIRIEVPFETFTGIEVPNGLMFIRAPGSYDKILIDDLVVVPKQSVGSGFGTAPGYVSEVEVKAGSYFLNILDSNGCGFTREVLVQEPDALSITYNATSPTSENGVDGSVTVAAAGGVPPYSYVWAQENASSNTDTVNNIAFGAYVVRVVDSHGCPKEFTVYVNPYIPPNIVSIREYNAKLSSGLAALVGIGFLICFFSGAMLYRYWAAFSILGSFLSCMVLVGCVLSFLAALVLLPEPTDALCTSFIWFLGVGFVLVYGCLFIKTWALYQVWRNAVRYQKAHLTPLYIIKCLCLAVTLEVVFLAIWTAIDPPKVRPVKSVNNSVENQCDTDHITFWIIFLVTKGIWLIFGAVLSVLTRNIAKEYNESSSIAYAIYNTVLLGAIAIPLAILLKEVPGGRLTVEVVIICIAYCFTMVVIFFRIWHSIMLPNKIPMNNNEMRQKRHTSSSGSLRSNTTADRSSRDSRGSPNQSSVSKAEVSASEAAV